MLWPHYERFTGSSNFQRFSAFFKWITLLRVSVCQETRSLGNLADFWLWRVWLKTKGTFWNEWLEFKRFGATAVWRRYLLHKFQCLLAGPLYLRSRRAGVQKSLGFNSCCAIPYLVAPVRDAGNCLQRLDTLAWMACFSMLTRPLTSLLTSLWTQTIPFAAVCYNDRPATSLPIGTIVKESLEHVLHSS